MDIKLKKTALQNLAKTAGEVAETAIRKELDKIIAVLNNENNYDHIAGQLDLLDIIAYRVHKETVPAITSFLKRLQDLELTYEEIPAYSIERLRKYHNKFTLMVKALGLLENLRYHQPFEVLDVFFEYSCHQEENVVKKAIHGIKKLAGYDLSIFYGNGKDWSGLGWQPQEKVLENITAFNETQRQKYISAIIVACEEMLSPTISGTSSTYKTVTWRTSAVPAIDGVEQIRKKCIVELQKLYAIATNVKQRKNVLNAMETASQFPHMGEYGEDVKAMIIENAITVAEFMKGIALSDNDMQILQKIEHDAYWLLQRKGSLDETIHRIALEIRDTLYANEEFLKFRILIGFESIFHDWERDEEVEDYNREREFREKEAIRLAETINTDSYREWRERIIRYAGIKSNDMAMFPYFGKFLEHFGRISPTLAMQLLLEIADQQEKFIVAILCGVAETESKKDVYSLIARWCAEGKYLFHLARFFEFSSGMDEELLKKIFDKAAEENDLNTLNQIISSVSAQYNEENKHLIKMFLVPVLEKLTAHKNSGWIFGFWFRKQRGQILADMEIEEHQAILDNLFWLRKIDYHAEEVLCAIAKRSPALVIQFFCNRLSKEKDEKDKDEYDAIPFDFHKLSQPLSQYPASAVDAVRDIYEDDYYLFAYRGARLLKNIFPNFPLEFQQKLLEVIRSKEEKDLLFVMAILRNYDGNPIIHDVCKEIVKTLPENSKLTGELNIILESTGVVHGEYGFVTAYKRKINEIKSWLLDENSEVKKFAHDLIAILERRIEYEQKRADEDITLRKYEYGED